MKKKNKYSSHFSNFCQRFPDVKLALEPPQHTSSQFKVKVTSLRHWPPERPSDLWEGHPTGAEKGRDGFMFNLSTLVIFILFCSDSSGRKVSFELSRGWSFVLKVRRLTDWLKANWSENEGQLISEPRHDGWEWCLICRGGGTLAEKRAANCV